MRKGLGVQGFRGLPVQGFRVGGVGLSGLGLMVLGPEFFRAVIVRALRLEPPRLHAGES